MKPIYIFGIGEIGKGVVKNLYLKEGIEIKGVIDIDPKKVGKSLYEITGIEKFSNIYVEEDAEKVLEREKGIVLHLTGSFVKDVFNQYMLIIDKGHNIITTTEEMTDPYLKNSELAEKIDKKAKEKGVTVLPTGINPGFAMDFLPAIFSGIFEEIYSIHVERINNASKRRYPLQKKIGSGLSKEEFKEKWEKREIGHVGLLESASIVSKILGLKIKNLEETCEPKIAKKLIKTKYFEVKKGKVCGIIHKVKIETEEKINIELLLEMSLDAKNPRDRILIEGKPTLEMKIKGGIPGDEATSSIVTNWINKIDNLPKGLITLNKLYFLSFFKKIQ
ncbi:MAG: hypothetical protein ABIM98_01645 [candidate division WOR-3 bacterium]